MPYTLNMLIKFLLNINTTGYKYQYQHDNTNSQTLDFRTEIQISNLIILNV